MGDCASVSGIGRPVAVALRSRVRQGPQRRCGSYRQREGKLRRQGHKGRSAIGWLFHAYQHADRCAEDLLQKIARRNPAMIVIVMGVVGAGKTTIGKLLASDLGWQFADADDFHPASNVEKISHGIPLTDEDREPWLDRLRTAILNWIADGQSTVLACSALKRAYRAKLQAAAAVQFVFLKGTAALIAQRLHARHGHFAGEAILASQLADLEKPERAITVEISRTPQQIVDQIRNALSLE